MKWVLVVYILTGLYTNTKALTEKHIPGWTSEEVCNQASRELTRKYPNLKADCHLDGSVINLNDFVLPEPR